MAACAALSFETDNDGSSDMDYVPSADSESEESSQQRMTIRLSIQAVLTPSAPTSP